MTAEIMNCDHAHNSCRVTFSHSELLLITGHFVNLFTNQNFVETKECSYHKKSKTLMWQRGGKASDFVKNKGASDK
jgi:hypothetical protein